MEPNARTPRSVAQIVHGERHQVAPGFSVRRPMPTRELRGVDPFLLLDHVGPTELAPGEGSGVPEHPHRGFEAVSFLFEGAMHHSDSRGNHATMRSGDVQWMTAGAGILHAEMLDERLRTEGGLMHAVQLWVNLPRSAKMTEPRYQNLAAASIPTVEREGARLRVIAGELFGTAGPAETHTPVLAVHVLLEPGASVRVPVAPEFNALAYVLEGSGRAGDADVAAGTLARFGADGDAVDLAAAADAPMTLLLLAGVPLNEPVIAYGPFVMNTRKEIEEAIDDYQAGRFGSIGVPG